jgi:hypothetical protein
VPVDDRWVDRHSATYHGPGTSRTHAIVRNYAPLSGAMHKADTALYKAKLAGLDRVDALAAAALTEKRRTV